VMSEVDKVSGPKGLRHTVDVNVIGANMDRDNSMSLTEPPEEVMFLRYVTGQAGNGWSGAKINGGLAVHVELCGRGLCEAQLSGELAEVEYITAATGGNVVLRLVGAK